jgi:hypothetical protein
MRTVPRCAIQFEAGRASDFFVSLALGKRFVATVIAVSARDVVKDDDPVPRLEISYARAHGSNHARGLVSENAWRGVRAGGDFLQISAADSAGVHSHQQFATANLWDWDGLHANVVHAAVDRRQHGGGNLLLFIFDLELSGNGHG